MFNYAKLSMDAKKAGGPDKLMDDVYQSGKQTGRIEALSAIALGVLVVGAGVFAIAKLTKKQRDSIDENFEDYGAIEPDENLCESPDEDEDAEEDSQEDSEI